MKDFSNGITRAILSTLTSEFTVDGSTVKTYGTAPTKAPDNFIWIDVVDYNDVGTKDSFNGELQVDVVVVTRVNTTEPSNVLLNSICSSVLTSLVNRGGSLNDPSGDLTIYSVVLSGYINGKQVIDNKLELYKRLQLTMLCQEN